MKNIFIGLFLSAPVIAAQYAHETKACTFEIFQGLQGVEARTLVTQLQSRNLTPDDHIPEFAALVIQHIDFIAKGLKDPAIIAEAKRISGSSNQSVRFKPEIEKALTLLGGLRAEANQRLAEGNVTYRWWVIFNFRLSALASLGLGLGAPEFSELYIEDLFNSADSHQSMERALSKSPLIPFIEIDLNRIFDQFPNYVFLPTKERLNLADFNERRGTGVYFIGIVNGYTMADGEIISPLQFLLHDVGHFLNSHDRECDWQSEIYKKQAWRMSPKEREAIDLVYFLWDHESEIGDLFTEQGIHRFNFGPGINFCQGCANNGTIIDFLPKEVVEGGQEVAEDWMTKAIEKTRAFFEFHKSKDGSEANS